jgi:hypothetical protein
MAVPDRDLSKSALRGPEGVIVTIMSRHQRKLLLSRINGSTLRVCVLKKSLLLMSQVECRHCRITSNTKLYFKASPTDPYGRARANERGDLSVSFGCETVK